MYELSVLFCHVFLIFVFNYLWIKEKKEYRKSFYKKITGMVNSFVIAQWVILLIFFIINAALYLFSLRGSDAIEWMKSYGLPFNIRNICYHARVWFGIEIIRFNNIIFPLSGIIYAVYTYKSHKPNMCILECDKNRDKKEFVVMAKIGEEASNKILVMYIIAILKTILKRSGIEVDEKILQEDVENILKTHEKS